MPHDAELNFLCEVFQKSRIPARIVSSEDLNEQSRGTYLEALTSSLPHLSPEWETLLPCTLYKLTDQFRRCFFLLLPQKGQSDKVLCIGPYFSSALTEADLLEIGEENGIPPKKQRYFREYLGSIPLLDGDSPLLTMLHTLCESLWETEAFSIVDLNNSVPSPAFFESELPSMENAASELIDVKAMEQRYAFENQLLRAVSMGQLHMESQFFSALSSTLLEKRHTDPLRNAKNYCIIMNTLLRKSAESGGVHPIYIDRVSSEFALRIEQLPSLGETESLMGDMFRSYCRLVRKHSVQKYSFAVQKAILLIDLNLSSDVSPSTLAKSLDVSLGYLSTIFRKETGITLSEHIRRRRIDHAKHLLKTTDLQIQTVALHCGIMDVQYFSKIFKKETGRSPKEYRDSKKSKARQ